MSSILGTIQLGLSSSSPLNWHEPVGRNGGTPAQGRRYCPRGQNFRELYYAPPRCHILHDSWSFTLPFHHVQYLCATFPHSFRCCIHVRAAPIKLGNRVKLSLVEIQRSTQEELFCLVIVKAYILTWRSWLIRQIILQSDSHLRRRRPMTWTSSSPCRM